MVLILLAVHIIRQQLTCKPGHHASVLRSHSWRTAANSAAYLLDSLKPDMSILDVGCGPGTITADLAKLVPQGKVIGLEYAPDVLDQARSHAEEGGVKNIEFAVGDVHALKYPDATFDVVHAHQVLQHIHDPVQALREMRRVTKPGGIVAARDSDYSMFTWFPEVEGMDYWQKTYLQVARANGGEPNAGRRIHAWAREAGFSRSDIKASSSVWCYSTPDEVAWWSNLWAERTLKSNFAKTATGRGLASQEDLDRIARIWQEWGAKEDAWFAVPSGEILCRV